MENKDIALGLLVIGVIALAGWVGFLYATPITKTKTETDEETVTVTNTVIQETGLPDDWGTADTNAYFTVYTEIGTGIKVYITDIFNGISLYYNQEATNGQKNQEYKYEYMQLISVDDPVSGRTFTGVNILDVLKSAEVFFACNISCKTNNAILYTNTYFNTTTKDIILNQEQDDIFTIVAIAADGLWLSDLGYGNFTVVQSQSTQTIYDLKEIRTIAEWEVDVIVNGTVEYQVNRTNIIDPLNPNGWHYEYHKEVESFGGRMTYNRTYWGTNISQIVNQTSAKNLNYTLQFESVDGFLSTKYNNTDVNIALARSKYSYVNNTFTQLPITSLLMTLIYMEQKFYEYGLDPTDPNWDKEYHKSYSGKGPFFVIIPGVTKNKYPGWVVSIRVTTYTGPIPK